MDLVRADGSRMPVLVNARTRTDGAGRPVAVRTTVFDATDRKQYEAELLAARRRAERVAAWMAAVEQVAADLAAVAGVEQVAAVIARAGTAVFGATTSTLWLVDESRGGYVGAGASGVEGAGRAPDDHGPFPDEEALRAGDVVQVPDGGTDLLVLAPLVALDRQVGVLALRLPRDRGPEPDELRLLQTLGQQAALALERARLFDEAQQVAETLQHAMLPHSLPGDPRLVLSACYRPAVDGLEVGGDWYDAFFLDPDTVAVVVGDIVGRGLHAAAAMGQLRSAIRALATVGGGPALLLTRLDRFVEGIEAAETATVAYAEVDLHTGRARYACAGHPPPVLVDATGHAMLLWDGRSAPLGAHFGVAQRAEAEVVLTGGSRLALYTDGLVERRDQALDEGLDALALALGRLSHQPQATYADAVTDAVLGPGRTPDDVCMLTLAFQEHATFSRTVAADVGQLSPLRADLSQWLRSHDVTGDDHDATVLACSEVVGNAMEHGYAGDASGVVAVLATVTPGVLRLRVSDSGRWRPPGPAADRGRGLQLVRDAMDQVVIDHVSGTIVTMRRQLAGP